MEVVFKTLKKSKVEIGDIVQLSVQQNKKNKLGIYIVKSDGAAPIGIVKDIFLNKKNRKRICIEYKRHFGFSQNYDIMVSYPVNADLFCNKNGQFTTVRENNSTPVIGMVVASPTASNSILKYFWI